MLEVLAVVCVILRSIQTDRVDRALSCVATINYVQQHGRGRLLCRVHCTAVARNKLTRVKNCFKPSRTYPFQSLYMETPCTHDILTRIIPPPCCGRQKLQSPRPCHKQRKIVVIQNITSTTSILKHVRSHNHTHPLRILEVRPYTHTQTTVNPQITTHIR